jgi:hypothetical protein
MNERIGQTITTQKGGTMKRYAMIATMVAALAGIWNPAHAQIAALDVIVALNDNGKGMDTAAALNATTAERGEMKNDEDGNAAAIRARDTVYVFEKWHHHAFMKEEGARQLWRDKGYGICGAFTPAVIAVNTLPLKDLINAMEITR